MPNAQQPSLTFSGIRVDMNTPEHAAAVQGEVSAHIVCDDFTDVQAWSAATGLATIVVETINEGSPYFRSRYYMGPKIRDNVEAGLYPAIDEAFLCEESYTHRNASSGHNGTQAFGWLSNKGYISYIGSYVWVVNSKIVEICNEVVSRISGEELPEPEVQPESVDLLSRLSVEYSYRGREIDKEMYHNLRDDGLESSLSLAFSISGQVVNPEQLLLSLVEG
jgi:hypothetical protein